MKINKLALAAIAVSLAATACKKDTEANMTLPPSSTKGIFINEVYSSNPDWVELYNSTSNEVNLTGFVLQDDKGAAEEYKIPAGTKIAAKSHIVIDAFAFGLSSSKGDQVALLDPQGGQVDLITLPVMEDGKSYGRTTDGAATWKKWDAPTRGKDNTTTGGGPSISINLLINEVVSSPSQGKDWIELYNNSDAVIDLQGLVIYDAGGVAKGYTFPAGVKIAARALMVVETFSGNTAGPTFGLSSGGDDVVIADKNGTVVDQITIPALATDQSYARIGNGGAQWQVTDTPTMGTANSTESSFSYVGKIIVNEVYTFSDQSAIEDLDWVELYNTTDAEIDLSGLLLWESGGRAEAWTMPSGLKIGAKAHLLIECDKFGLHSNPTNYPAWGLSKGPGEYIVLATSDFSRIDSISCPSMNRNESYGRKTDGANIWQIFAQYTKNTANTGGARVEHVNTTGIYINEVYHDNSANTGIENAGWDPSVDFIEFHNTTTSVVDISGWEIYDDTDDDSKKYVVPQGTTIAAKGYLVYDVFKANTNGPTFGLGVSGDWVYIYKPGKSELVDVVEIPGFGKESGLRDKGYSFGRLTDGGSDLTIFKQASKGSSNNGKAILPQE